MYLLLTSARQILTIKNEKKNNVNKVDVLAVATEKCQCQNGINDMKMI